MITITKQGWMDYHRNGIEVFTDKEKAAKAWENLTGWAVSGLNFCDGDGTEIVRFFEALEKEYNRIKA